MSKGFLFKCGLIQVRRRCYLRGNRFLSLRWFCSFFRLKPSGRFERLVGRCWRQNFWWCLGVRNPWFWLMKFYRIAMGTCAVIGWFKIGLGFWTLVLRSGMIIIVGPMELVAWLERTSSWNILPSRWKRRKIDTSQRSNLVSFHRSGQFK